MTYEEISLAMDFFGGAIDYNSVDIQDTSLSAPWVSGNTIYIPKSMGGESHDQATKYKGRIIEENFCMKWSMYAKTKMENL